MLQPKPNRRVKFIAHKNGWLENAGIETYIENPILKEGKSMVNPAHLQPRIRVHLGPDDQPAIINPHHKGAVVDYKSTALNLAAQVLALDHALNEQQALEASLRSDIKSKDVAFNLYKQVHHERWQILRAVCAHWTFTFLPKDVKATIAKEMGH